MAASYESRIRCLEGLNLQIGFWHDPEGVLNSEKIKSVIAIDGPAASGKSTIGRMLANHLVFLFLDTGCMYRAVTLAVLQRGIDIDDEAAVVDLTESVELDILPPWGKKDGRLYTVLLDGQDVTWDIRTSEVDLNVSQVSAYKGVRQNLVDRQRILAKRGSVIVVGRDIGTVVLPEAPLKLYIIASTEERAYRRWIEQRNREKSLTYDQILADLIRRDRIDGNREHSPMRPAEDAVIIDTTGLSPEQILNQILTLDYFHALGESR
jgi:cytidylate kinase